MEVRLHCSWLSLSGMMDEFVHWCYSDSLQVYRNHDGHEL